MLLESAKMVIVYVSMVTKRFLIAFLNLISMAFIDVNVKKVGKLQILENCIILP